MDTIMEVFVYTAFGVWFSIGFDMWDTVLTIKQKIEKIQRIPVSKQTLYFNSKVLDDNLDIMQCNIFNKSCIFLIISPEYNPNQNNDQLPYQTKQSPTEASNRSNQFISPQAWPVMVNDQVLPQNEPPLLTAESFEEFFHQDSPVMMEGKDHQLLHQTGQSFAETIYTEDDLLSDISEIQTKENIHSLYSQVMMDDRNNQVLNQNKQRSVPSNSSGEAIYNQEQALSDSSNIQIFGLGKGKGENIHGQYSPMMLQGSYDQVLPQTEPPLVTAESVEEFFEYQGRNSQVLHHNEQPSVPLNSSAETIYSQDQSLSDICKIQRFGLGNTKENIHSQYSQVMMENRNSQVVHRNEQLSVPSNSFVEAIYSQDQALSDISKIQRFESVNTEEIDQGQYLPLRNITNSLPPNCNEVFFGVKDHPSVPVGGSSRSNQSESLTLNLSQELLGTQDVQPVPGGNNSRNRNKGIKTKKSPKPVSVKRKIIMTPDSPERKRKKRVEFTVMVQPFQETRKIPVKVNVYEKVEELREILAQLKEKGELILPEEGYFFIHKQDVLIDHLTFEENLVDPGDTIEIFRGKVTYPKN